MRPVGADREQELEKHLGRLVAFGEAAAAQFAAQPGKLAGGEGQGEGLAAVVERGVLGTLDRLQPPSDRPAARELVVAGGEPAQGRLRRLLLLAAAADDLPPEDGRAVTGGSQRLPAQRG